MITRRSFTALFLLMLAFLLQLWFASAGIVINLVFASLIIFAFFLGILELVFFILFALFILNWQPAVSIETIIFALVPLAAFWAKGFFKWEPWVGGLASIAIGVVIFYAALAPFAFLTLWQLFLIDFLGSIIFGAGALLALGSREG